MKRQLRRAQMESCPAVVMKKVSRNGTNCPSSNSATTIGAPNNNNNNNNSDSIKTVVEEVVEESLGLESDGLLTGELITDISGVIKKHGLFDLDQASREGMPRDLAELAVAEQLQEIIGAGAAKVGEVPLNTVQIASHCRQLLAMYNLGQRLFAKTVLNQSQGSLSELLSKPRPWHRLTEKGREAFRKIYAWVSDERAVVLLRTLSPRRVYNNPGSYAFGAKEESSASTETGAPSQSSNNACGSSSSSTKSEKEKQNSAVNPEKQAAVASGTHEVSVKTENGGEKEQEKDSSSTVSWFNTCQGLSKNYVTPVVKFNGHVRGRRPRICRLISRA